MFSFCLNLNTEEEKQVNTPLLTVNEGNVFLSKKKRGRAVTLHVGQGMLLLPFKTHNPMER